MTTSEFVCSSCGGGSVEINRAHPSLDERYPVGHCMTCTPWPKAKPHPFRPNETIQPARKTVALLRSDLFDREAHEHRRKVDRAVKLAAKLHSPKASRMSPEQLSEASEAAAWLRRDES
jgi:hypothetical protein